MLHLLLLCGVMNVLAGKETEVNSSIAELSLVFCYTSIIVLIYTFLAIGNLVCLSMAI